MRLTPALVMASIILATPVVAVAQSTAPVPQTPPAPAVVQPAAAGQMPAYCKYYYFYNSLIRKPVCLTPEQWAKMRYRTQEDVREFQQRSFTQGMP